MTKSEIIDEDGVRVADERFCAFTDDNGHGPDIVYLTQVKAWDARSAEMEIRERSLMLGLDFDPSDDHSVSDFMPGCLTMTAATVTWLRDQLTAWLDAPRLAARETPTVAAEHDGIRLLTTSSGEWGVADDESPSWLSCEAEARYEFREATGTVSCESCARFIDRSDAHVDADGIYGCADEAACSAAHAAKESK